MDGLRKPFQGVKNIIQFNWHFYVFALLGIGLLIGIGFIYPSVKLLSALMAFGIFLSTFISLFVSYWVYDYSDLYSFSLLKELQIDPHSIVNIHAGFDESSLLLNSKFSKANIEILDFYDPKLHTEVSIKRARRKYPAIPGTMKIKTNMLPQENHSIDLITLIMSAHEIRKEEERKIFFKELFRILKPNGKIYIVEHQRDLANFLAFNVGFFHFMSPQTWIETFQNANFKIEKEKKCTPFVTQYMIEKNGNTP